MTNRTLTALAIRFAALLLFMKIFDHFGAYFFSAAAASAIAFARENLNTAFNKFFYQGIFLLIANTVIFLFLFFKAEWISTKLIKQDKDIAVNLTPEKIIASIILSTGLLWLASAIFQLPDAFEYVQWAIGELNHEEYIRKFDFGPAYFIMKTILALLFIFKVDKITRFASNRMRSLNAAE
jgi:hypothetical protein